MSEAIVDPENGIGFGIVENVVQCYYATSIPHNFAACASETESETGGRLAAILGVGQKTTSESESEDSTQP